MKSGNPNFLEPSGPLQACNGTDLPILPMGTNLTNQNSIQEEIKNRLKSGSVCCHSVQNILYSSLPSKNLKIKIYGNKILPVVLFGCETWSLTLRDKRRLRYLRIGC